MDHAILRESTVVTVTAFRQRIENAEAWTGLRLRADRDLGELEGVQPEQADALLPIEEADGEGGGLPELLRRDPRWLELPTLLIASGSDERTPP